MPEHNQPSETEQGPITQRGAELAAELAQINTAEAAPAPITPEQREAMLEPAFPMNTQVAVQRNQQEDGTPGAFELDWRVQRFEEGIYTVVKPDPEGKGTLEKELSPQRLAQMQMMIDFPSGTEVKYTGDDKAGDRKWIVEGRGRNGDVRILTETADPHNEPTFIRTVPAATLALMQREQPATPTKQGLLSRFRKR